MSLKCCEWINLFLGSCSCWSWVTPALSARGGASWASTALKVNSNSSQDTEAAFQSARCDATLTKCMATSRELETIYCHQSCIVFLVEESRGVVQEGVFTGERSFTMQLNSDLAVCEETHLKVYCCQREAEMSQSHTDGCHSEEQGPSRISLTSHDIWKRAATKGNFHYHQQKISISQSSNWNIHIASFVRPAV